MPSSQSRTVAMHFARATAGLFASILILLAGCGGRVVVDTREKVGDDPPPVEVHEPCDAGSFHDVFGSASSAAIAAPWSEPSVVADASCNIVVAGTPSSDLDFGGGPVAPGGGLFVAKLGPSGKSLWTRHVDATFQALGAGADGHVVLSGRFVGSVDFGGGVTVAAPGEANFVVVLDAEGAPVWSREFGNDAYPAKVLIDPSGSVFVIGTLQGSVDFGGGPLTSAPLALFVARFDSAGGLAYSRVFPGVSSVDAGIDGSGNLLVTGTFRGTLDLGGGPMTSTVGPSNRDLFVAKLGPSGEHLWSRSFGGPGSNTYLSRISVDASGGAYLTGTFGGSLDLGGGPLEPAGPTGEAEVVPIDAMFLARFGSNGEHVFSRGFGHGLLLPSAVEPTADGGVVAVVSYQTAVDFGGGPLAAPAGYGFLLGTFTGAGEHVVSRGFEGAASAASVTANLTVDRSGKPLLVGTVVGSVDLDEGVLAGSELGSFFVAKLDR